MSLQQLRKQAYRNLIESNSEYKFSEDDLSLYAWPILFNRKEETIFMFITPRPRNDAAAFCCGNWRLFKHGEYTIMKSIKFDKKENEPEIRGDTKPLYKDEEKKMTWVDFDTGWIHNE